MRTKQGKDLQPGDRLVRQDGQALTIKTLTNGMVRDSRMAEFANGEWANVLNKTEYHVEDSSKRRGAN